MSPPICFFFPQSLTIVISKLSDGIEVVGLLRNKCALGKVWKRIDQVVLIRKLLDVLKQMIFRDVCERILNPTTRK